MHAKRVCKDFQINNLDEYYDSYVQSETLKQIPQNLMKDLSLMTKINIASETITNLRVTSPGNDYCQIRIKTGERRGIPVIICFFLVVRQEHVYVNGFLHKSLCIKTSEIFRLLKPA